MNSYIPMAIAADIVSHTLVLISYNNLFTLLQMTVGPTNVDVRLEVNPSNQSEVLEAQTNEHVRNMFETHPERQALGSAQNPTEVPHEETHTPTVSSS